MRVGLNEFGWPPGTISIIFGCGDVSRLAGSPLIPFNSFLIFLVTFFIKKKSDWVRATPGKSSIKDAKDE
jgi:hypothetical protein